MALCFIKAVIKQVVIMQGNSLYNLYMYCWNNVKVPQNHSSNSSGVRFSIDQSVVGPRSI